MYDVAVIGGGPAGSTVASMLMRYAPTMKVVVLERERFPRDHVGESQLPMVCEVLNEIGAWDAVEAANFPIKIGATYRWGQTADLWDFEFVPGVDFDDAPRPGKFEGLRAQTAFQVDRATYDDILLRHSAALGAEVRQETRVAGVDRDGDRITGLRLADGETVRARYYVDASGSAGVLRRAMDVETEAPTQLRNIAIWDYWQDAEWAVTLGNGGTRIQVMSLGWGWIWFIPIGKTRTSVGLVMPASAYKESKLRPSDLYNKALAEEPRIAHLLRNATREQKLATTKDWSFWSDRAYGENWFLTGEALGFADPILSAGMTLAHTGAREVAYTILELDRGELDPQWLKQRYEETQTTRLRAHIKFAEFWYAGNGIFQDVREYTREIARDNGLELNADDAFRWLSTGGFSSERLDTAQLATWDVTAMKILAQQFCGGDANWAISENNVLTLDLEGATNEEIPGLRDGRIERVKCYARAGRKLPKFGLYRVLTRALAKYDSAPLVMREAEAILAREGANPAEFRSKLVQTLEAMVAEGWVKASRREGMPHIAVKTPDETWAIHANRDPEPAPVR
jgi:flavin-dependent dehydrogenase